MNVGIRRRGTRSIGVTPTGAMNVKSPLLIEGGTLNFILLEGAGTVSLFIEG